MTLFHFLRDELRTKNFGLHYDEPSYFVNSQWRGFHPYIFIIYRVALAGYCVIWLVWTGIKDGVIEDQRSAFITYYTNWVFILVTLHTCVSAVSTFYHHIIRAKHNMRFAEPVDRDVDFPMSMSTEPITLRDTDNEAEGESIQVRVITDIQIFTPWYLRFSWLLYEISLASCLLLTLLFWTAVYDGKFTDTKFNSNAFITVLLVFDTFITKIPVRVLHCIYPVLFFACYLIFNVLYTKYGSVFPQKEPYIYKLLDWRYPLVPAAAVVVIQFLLLPMLHLGSYGLYQCRLYLWKHHG